MKASKRVVARKLPQKKLLKEVFLSMDEQERSDFLAVLGTSKAYLMQIYGGHSAGSAEMAQAIESATCGVVKARYLRPDLFSN